MKMRERKSRLRGRQGMAFGPRLVRRLIEIACVLRRASRIDKRRHRRMLRQQPRRMLIRCRLPGATWAMLDAGSR